MNEPRQPQSKTDGSTIIRPPRRQLWGSLLLYLVIFLSGGVAGMGTSLLMIRARAMHAVHHPEEMPELIVARLERVLALDDEQTRRVGEILKKRQRALQGIRRRYQPEVEAELDAVDRQIAEVLDEEQRETWRERFRDLRDTWVPALPDS